MQVTTLRVMRYPVTPYPCYFVKAKAKQAVVSDMSMVALRIVGPIFLWPLFHYFKNWKLVSSTLPEKKNPELSPLIFGNVPTVYRTKTWGLQKPFYQQAFFP